MTPLPQSRALTRHDLEQMPDDGHRYELIDGALLVTPAPRPRHQEVVLNLAIILKAACPPQLKVAVAPLDVHLGEDTVLQPDVLVAERASFDDTGLVGPPLLAVEVRSPSTRLIDAGLKRARYEVAGAPSYWTVDPDALIVTAWQLEGGRYTNETTVRPPERFETQMPFIVSLNPSDLLD